MRDGDWKNAPSFEYSLRYDHTDIVVSASDKVTSRINNLLKEPPSNQLCSALECVQRRYYPGPHKLPWDHHRQELTGTRRKNAQARKALTKTPWPMAWYWKALLPTLRQWDESCKNRWRVAIRQVRQWVMVLIYETYAGKQRLLRPPLFGPSQRILQNDQYWVLLAFDEKIKDAWESARAKGDYERLNVLGRHDVIYRIYEFAPNKFVGNPSLDDAPDTSLELTVKLQCWLDLDPHIIPSDDPSLSIIKSMLTLDEGTKPHELTPVANPYALMTLPSMGNETGDPKSTSLLLSSDRVCEAVAELSEVWNDPTCKSILIHAPPGSGKEILAKSIYDFRRFEGKYVPFVLSPDPSLAEFNQRMLYFRDMSDAEGAGEVVAMINGDLDEKSEMAGTISDGLVFKARKGVLFLDEIDKEEEGKARAGLLRLLENDEFPVFGTTLVVKLPKAQLPTYVFAGSRGTLLDILRLKPTDFWTRISHFIEMQHPLTGSAVDEQTQICADYFHMFWNNHVPTFFKESSLLPYPLFQTTAPEGQTSAHPFLHDYTAALFWSLMNLDVKRLLAKTCARLLLTRRRAEQISVRNIRSVVGRIVFSLVDLLLYDKGLDKPLARIRNRLAELSTNEARLAIPIKKHWGHVLTQVLAGQEFREDDPELFDLEGESRNEAEIANLCRDINLEIAKMQPEIDRIMDTAISTLPSLD